MILILCQDEKKLADDESRRDDEGLNNLQRGGPDKGSRPFA